MDTLLSLVANDDNLSQLAEGKTKVIYAIKSDQDHVLIRSKDQLTAFNAARKDQLQGKARIANNTTVNVFKFLDEIAKKCEMIPIEWVARRVATGSFLKRNPGVPQGYRFAEPKIETFFKDDENDDPQYSDEQIECAGFEYNGIKIGKSEINVMKRMTSVIFKALELWPQGDRRLQLDKQFYRDMKEVTAEALQQLISNYEKVMDLTADFSAPSRCRAVVIMGSPADKDHCSKIAAHCKLLGITPVIRISSAHKTTREALDIIAEYESDETPTVVIAVAGRSNGLGPVLAGNYTLPVINCPPVNESTVSTDIWSSLRMPSGMGCSTVLGADEAAMCAAKMMTSHDHMVYGRVLAAQLNTAIKLAKADRSCFGEKC
ncbi:unnamed protein product [Nippostrongylus brasiliensis]|uniref:Probable multifunctional protein ADE2 (inferred by orthology to a C. elegans protein) n=1 Tax=Nippostrongylus brasiliensis TaxID=27835 RepID=A0A158R2Q1_NIPBR|nr:unnamed protein product [Nippostrongylus brasiliensis]